MDIQILNDAAILAIWDGQPPAHFSLLSMPKNLKPAKRHAWRLWEQIQYFSLAERDTEKPWESGERDKWLQLIQTTGQALADALPERDAKIIRDACTDDGAYGVFTECFPTAPVQDAADPAPVVAAGASGKPGPENAEQRQERRYQMCIDAKLTVPSDTYKHLPRGIGKLARAERISTAAFSKDVKLHIERLSGG